MSIGALTSSIASQAKPFYLKAGTKVESTLNALASGSKINKTSDDVGSLSSATALRAQITSLKQASTNLAGAYSLTQVAEQGVNRAVDVLDRIKSLAVQSQSAVSEDTRRAIDEEFQGLRATLDDIAATTSFSGKKLLDGSLQKEQALSLNTVLGQKADSADDTLLSLPALGSVNLLPAGITLLNPNDAARVSAAADSALTTLSQSRATLGAFTQTIDSTNAAYETALNNQEAAASTLTDTDFAESSSQNVLAQLQTQAAIALQAQGNKLSPALLRLVA